MSKPLKAPRETGGIAANREIDIDVLARTLYGEARGEGVRGLEAVATVIMNRLARARRHGGYWWGGSVAAICRRPWQFSCWNADDPNRAKIEAVTPGNRMFASCLRIARRAVSQTLPDPTAGATHYHARPVNPPWSQGRGACAEIGNHLFYNNVE